MTLNEFIKNNKSWLNLYRQIKLVDEIIGTKFFKSALELVEYARNIYLDEETSVYGEQINIYTYAIYVN